MAQAFVTKPDAFNMPDAAVDPAVFGIVIQKHNLSADFELQTFSRGIIFLAEIPLNLGFGNIQDTVQSFQHLPVDRIGRLIGGGKGDFEFFGAFGVYVGSDPAVKALQIFGRHHIIANVVQQADKHVVFLAIDFF